MAKVKTKKKASLAMKLNRFAFSILALLLIGFFVKGTAGEVIESYQLNQELKNVKGMLETLSVEQESLELEKKRLNDPAYVENYARGKHLLSKTDEQVFILPKGE